MISIILYVTEILFRNCITSRICFINAMQKVKIVT